MSSEPGPVEPRSSVRVSRVRGGERTWQITVAAGDETAEALRAAVALARELDDELTRVYITAGEPAQDDVDAGGLF
jgi:hypothetical protein